MEILIVRGVWSDILELKNNAIIVHFNRTWAKKYKVNDQS